MLNHRSLPPWTAALLLMTSVLASALSCGGPTTPGGDPPPPVGAPSLKCPADVLVDTERAPAAATFAATASGGSAPVSTVCTPVSGSTFPEGASAVTCLATDSVGRTAQCGFQVIVSVVPRLEGTSFLAFGDSLTAGEVSAPVTGVNDVDPVHAYPAVLLDRLKAVYRLQQTEISVVNAGLGRETAGEGEDRLVEEIANVRPKALLLMEGTNDIERGIAAASTANSLSLDVRRAYTRGVEIVFLATVLPQVPGRLHTAKPEAVVALNALIRDVAAEQDAVLVDTFAAVDPQKELLIGEDGIHATIEGYRVVAETFLAAIRDHYQLPPPGPAPAASLPSLFGRARLR